MLVASSGEGGETAQPGRGRGPGGGGSVPEGEGLFERAPCFGEPAAQEPVPGQGVDDPQGVVVVAVERGVQRGAQVGGLGVQAPQPAPLVRRRRRGAARSARSV